MDWYLILSLVTLVLILFTIVWGTGLWVRREKIKIKVTKPSYIANEYDRELRIIWSCELQRLGGEEIRYTAHICLKPDAQVYHKLEEYFDLPRDGVIRTYNQLELERGKIISTGRGVDTGVYPEYDALIDTGDSEKWKIAKQLSSKLREKEFEVGLIWEDKPNKKPKWRKIKQEDHGKWIKL
jgi:hypothetical protein